MIEEKYVGLLSYDEARKYNEDEENGINISLVRKVWDTQSSSVYNPMTAFKGFNTLAVIIRLTGIRYPFGPFNRFQDGTWKARDVYDEMVELSNAPIKRRDKNGYLTIFKVFYKVFSTYRDDWWWDGLEPEHRMDGQELVDAYSGWLYGVVQGITGEFSTRKRLENFFKGSDYTVHVAPVSMEVEDTDIIIRGNGEEYSVSVKCGNKRGIESAIKFEQGNGKVNDFYCGYYKEGKKKVFYASPDGKFFETFKDVFTGMVVNA